ncbi:hypothetical protein GJ744_008355 [Endocarpon pusillum]|uniref:Uncharacterized protein n=1 Tax=Endocarpon pusillum TaxID=364733 RepID=A0A8H7E5N6_9EURO|nr:hypothetical protein GJ744_008355 [Endocarpon pusillum]
MNTTPAPQFSLSLTEKRARDKQAAQQKPPSDSQKKTRERREKAIPSEKAGGGPLYNGISMNGAKLSFDTPGEETGSGTGEIDERRGIEYDSEWQKRQPDHGEFPLARLTFKLN